MITMTAEIRGNKSAGEIKNIFQVDNFDIGRSNISSKPIDILNNTKPYMNPYMVGKSILGDGSRFYSSKSENPFIGGLASSSTADTNGDYPFIKNGNVYYEFELYCENLNSFYIIFDVNGINTPSAIYLTFSSLPNAEETKVDVLNGIARVNGLDNVNYLRVRVKEMKVPNTPLYIYGIISGYTISIDNTNCQDIQFTLDERADNTLPSWGVISNTGSLQFTDYFNQVRDLIDSYSLDRNSDIVVYLENTLVADSRQVVGIYHSQNWDYDENTKQVTIEFNDDLLALQSIMFEYLYDDSGYPTAFDIYEILRDATPFSDRIQLEDEIDTYLHSIYVPYICFYSDNLWEQWNKFCEFSGVYLYIDANQVVIRREFI